jgi:hypothetical protein
VTATLPGADRTARSLPRCAIHRAITDDGLPILVITDGVTTVVFDWDMRDVFEMIEAVDRLSVAVQEYAVFVRAALTGQ